MRAQQHFSPLIACCAGVLAVYSAQPLPAQRIAPTNVPPTAGPTAAGIPPPRPGSAGAGASAGFKPRGSIHLDLPYEADAGSPFDVEVLLTPRVSGDDTPVPIYMEHTPKVRYDPRTFTMRPSERRTVAVTVLKSKAGLALLLATANGWETGSGVVDVGFQGRLSHTLGPSQLAATPNTFALGFVDGKGNPLSLDAPVLLRVEASSAGIRTAGEPGPFRPELQILVPTGARRGPLLELKPSIWSTGKGTLRVRGFINTEHGILDEDFPLSVSSPWWMQLGSTVLGSILCLAFVGRRRPSGEPIGILARIGLSLLTGFPGLLLGA